MQKQACGPPRSQSHRAQTIASRPSRHHNHRTCCGAGDDTVSFQATRSVAAAIDLGSGNDVLWLGHTLARGTTTLTLGAGQDRVILTEDAAVDHTITVTDFAAGADGDVLDLSRALAVSGPDWLGFTGIANNPFAQGRLLLHQDGADTLVIFDNNGTAADTLTAPQFVLLRLVGVDTGQLTAANFAGLDPSGTPLALAAQMGTAGDDARTEGGGGNDRLEGAAGADRITFTGLPLKGTMLTLGSGTDVVTLGSGLSSQERAAITITDFQPGAGGDIFDIAELFRSEFGLDFDKLRLIAGDVDELYNAFTAAARLEQQGADTVLLFRTGSRDEVVAVFQNTHAVDFTAYNVGGLQVHLVTADLGAGNDDWTGTAGADVVQGNAGDDVLRGLGGDDILRGGAGSDWLEGGDGDDLLYGGLGNDALTGGARSDILLGDGGADLLVGGAGDDFLDGGFGADLLDGGLGFDTASWIDATAPLRIDLAAGTACILVETDYLRSIEEVIGSRGSDVIAGASAGEVLIGLAGNDALDGREGDDTLWGGSGRDIMTGGAGADRFIFEAGDGADTVTDLAAGDRFEVYGYSGYRSLVQEAGGLRVALSATDSILLKGVTSAALANAALRFDAGLVSLTLPSASDTAVVADADFTVGAGITLRISDPDPVLRGYGPPIHSTAIQLTSPRTLGGIGLYLGGVVRFTTVFESAISIGASGVRSGYGDDVDFAAISTAGKLIVDARHGTAIGLANLSQVYNRGAITVTAHDGDASGVFQIALGRANDASAPNVFVNLGVISVTASGVARGVDLGSNSSGALLEANYGKILVEGAGGSVGIQNAMDAHPKASQPRMVNTGTISVSDDTASLDSAGLQIDDRSHAKVWNTGTITADFAVQVRVASYDSNGSYSLDLFNGGTLNGLVVTSAYNDIVVNTGAINGTVDLGGGDDVFDGRAGRLTGRLSGYDGNDILLAGPAAQVIDGGFGNDTLSGGAGDDTLIGGAGRDVFRFGIGFAADTITDLLVGQAHETIAVEGYAAAQSITQQGDDVLIAFSASDTLLVRHATVADIESGVLRFGYAAIPDYAIGALPTAPAEPAGPREPVDPGITFTPITGTASADTLVGDIGPDRIAGLAGNDLIDGNSGGDFLDGGGGDDTVMGGSDNDHIAGGDGADVLRGDAGNDDLSGGADADLLVGGLGADVFRYAALVESTPAARDVISDFRAGDRIDLSAIDAVPGGANDAFSWLAAAPTEGARTGVVWFDSIARVLYASTDADAAPEFAVRVAGSAVLSAIDIVL